MDNQSQNPTSSGSQPVKKTSYKLFFAMSIEVIFFIIIFSGFLFVLNYFNILRLDPAFPFLSFLPHLPRTVQQTTTHAPNPTPQALPTNQPFIYDTQKGDEILQQYLHEILLPTSQPPAGTQLDKALPRNITSLAWTSQSPAFSGVGTVEYSLGTNNLRRLSILISPTNIPSQNTLSPDVIIPFIKTYFQNLPQLSSWVCQSLQSNVSVCEQFKDEGDKKEGYGAALNKKGVLNNPKPIFFLFTCRFLKGDPFYDQKTSCLELTPVK